MKREKAAGGSSSRMARQDQVKMKDGLVLQNVLEKAGGQAAGQTGIALQELKRPGGTDKQAETTRPQEDPAYGSSCSSGAAEIQYVLNLIKARDREDKEGSKDFPAVAAIYEGIHPSSSGSDGEVLPSKARSLRKTKSRGKGKGKSRLTAVDGFDDFVFDNHAFSSASDTESKADGAKRKPVAKQAWP